MFAVGGHGHASRIGEHAQRVFYRLIVVAQNGNPAPAHPVGITVFAKKHAVPEALFHAGNLRRPMENAGRDEQSLCSISFSFSFQDEDGFARRYRFDLIPDDARFVTPRLSPSVL